MDIRFGRRLLSGARFARWVLFVPLALVACASPAPLAPSAGSSGPALHTDKGGDGGVEVDGADPVQAALAQMTPVRGRAGAETRDRLHEAARAFFAESSAARLYVHTDRPLYRPGETVRLRVWALAAATLAPETAPRTVTVELIGPRGDAVVKRAIETSTAVAEAALAIPQTAPGGAYAVRAASGGAQAERPVTVASYQPPRIAKQLVFLRAAYRPGEEVTAALSLRGPDGAPLAGARIDAIATASGREIARPRFTSDRAGRAAIRVRLPDTMSRPDARLTLIVRDGGGAEAIGRRIPVALPGVSLALYPEGGELVAGLPGRVYFAATDRAGAPTPVRGRVVDDLGREVAELASERRGLGRFALTPAPGRRYHVEIAGDAASSGGGGRATGATGATVGDAPQRFAVPAARDDGCVMQAVDVRADRGVRDPDIRIGVWCRRARTVTVAAALRERVAAFATADVAAGAPTVFALPLPAGAQGAARVTLLDAELTPVAERLVYRNLGADMRVTLSTVRESYMPGERVTLAIRTTDPAGRPIPADLSLAVVDDAALSFADSFAAERAADLLAAVYLEAEMPGQTVAEPRFYFSGDPAAPRALDLVLGTQGWRRFTWAQRLSPDRDADRILDIDDLCPDEPENYNGYDDEDGCPDRARVVIQANRIILSEPAIDGALGEADDTGVRQADTRGGQTASMTRELPTPSEAPVRPRSDFRETVHWAASVRTDARGRATAAFSLSDAVTSFRAVAEGVGRVRAGGARGLPGRGELVFASALPVTATMIAPPEVAAGDVIRLPITIANATERAHQARLTVRAGAAFELRDAPAAVTVAANGRQTVHATLRARPDGHGLDDSITIEVRGAGQVDAVTRKIPVAPPGYPRRVSASGTVADKARHAFDLSAALPGTISATATLYPSPLASMIQGAEALMREPVGCFEQASSANYPNIMVLRYMQEHGVADSELAARARGLLDRGYDKLTGYESPSRGYEWFGGDPGHEALTAYGLLEFADMAAIHPVDSAMVARTRAWLRSRRDGRGGFRKNAKALDSFGRASDAVTDGYITYALARTGDRDLAPELARQREVAAQTSDPYLLALAVHTLVTLARGEPWTRAAAARLAGMQAADGGLPGADHSITRSGGAALAIETTALAATALMRAGGHSAAVQRAIDWLRAQRGDHGRFGSTQSTILALEALTLHARQSRRASRAGAATIAVDGRRVGRLSFAAGAEDTLRFDNIGAQMRAGAGESVVDLAVTGAAMPYSVTVDYRTAQPASSASAPVSVSATLDRAVVAVGEPVRLMAVIENRTAAGVPMTVARIGVPGGLAIQDRALAALREAGAIAFYETGPREVVLYWRQLGPRARVQVPIDLIARVPGVYAGPPSRAYLYYTDEHQLWAPPVRIAIGESARG